MRLKKSKEQWVSWEEATDEKCDRHLSQTQEGSWVESSRPGDQAIVEGAIRGGTGNNVGSDSGVPVVDLLDVMLPSSPECTTHKAMKEETFVREARAI